MNDNQQQNPLEYRVKMLEDDSRRNQETHKEFFARFEAISEKMARSDERYTQICRDTAEIKASVDELTKAIQTINEKPAKRWETIAAAVISAIAGAVVAYIFARMGLSA